MGIRAEADGGENEREEMNESHAIPCPIHWEGDFAQAGKSHVICRTCGVRFKVDRGEGWSNYRVEPEPVKARGK